MQEQHPKEHLQEITERLEQEVILKKGQELTIPLSPKNKTNIEIGARLSGIRDNAEELGTSKWWAEWRDSLCNPLSRVALTWGNGRSGPMMEKRYIHVEVTRTGVTEPLLQTDLDHDVNLGSGGLNVLSIDINEAGTMAKYWLGDDVGLYCGAAAFPDSLLREATNISVGASNKLRVQFAAVKSIIDPYSPDKLQGMGSSSTDVEGIVSSDPLVGNWKYFDRDMDPKWATLGELYNIAIMPDTVSGSYKVIYAGSANPPAEPSLTSHASMGSDLPAFWRKGMLKGRLTSTIFPGHYNLFWLDAAMTPMEGYDTFADIEAEGSILSLHFPLWKATVRFVKSNPKTDK